MVIKTIKDNSIVVELDFNDVKWIAKELPQNDMVTQSFYKLLLKMNDHRLHT